MKRLLTLLVALAALAAIPSSASASVSETWANNYAHDIARNDCGRASDWWCWDFPVANSHYSCAANRWCSGWQYREHPTNWPLRGERSCVTDVHFAISTGAITYHNKYCF